jgi:fatty acid desaturase
MMNVGEEYKPQRIRWYRSPVSRENLAMLNKRSDLKGFLQAGGYLGLIAATGTNACLSAVYLPWYVAVIAFLFHGICYSFIVNGFHELIHDSVFKTRWLNRFFLWIHSFLAWFNHIHFWASHTEHHKYTLHQPEDLEVVLPQQMRFWAFIKGAIVDPVDMWNAVRATIRHARNQLKGEWETHLFTVVKPQWRKRMVRWSQFVLCGHLVIVAVSLYFGLWYIPLAVTCGRFYGRGIQTLCNASQHIGLQDEVPDFRLCCRTIILSPFWRFLYWHMNYHTEHHMYAAVPCYNLGKLHRLIKDDMPHCPRGLYETWTHIAAVLKKQDENPSYQFIAELPQRDGAVTPAA